MDILKLVESEHLIAFSQNFSVTRNYLGDRIFPDTKTENLTADFYRLSDPLMLPKMALVHAFDTEAHIGRRPAAEKVRIEKMLIKEKINQTERVQEFLEHGGNQDGIIRYIFDDAARLAESVKTRTEVMKCEAIQTGKITVRENNLTLTLDYGVPASNKGIVDVSSDTADFLGQVQTLIDSAADAGYRITEFVTTSKFMTHIRKNKGIQTAIYSALGQGAFISNVQFANLMRDMFGVTLTVYDARYQYEGKNGQLTAKRYIDDNAFIGLATLPDNTMGVGLWGPTPEESAQGAFTSKNMTQFITVTQWQEPDPVAVWTKTSGLFVPVIPNPKGIFPYTVKYE